MDYKTVAPSSLEILPIDFMSTIDTALSGAAHRKLNGLAGWFSPSVSTLEYTRSSDGTPVTLDITLKSVGSKPLRHSQISFSFAGPHADKFIVTKNSLLDRPRLGDDSGLLNPGVSFTVSVSYIGRSKGNLRSALLVNVCLAHVTQRMPPRLVLPIYAFGNSSYKGAGDYQGNSYDAYDDAGSSGGSFSAAMSCC